MRRAKVFISYRGYNFFFFSQIFYVCKLYRCTFLVIVQLILIMYFQCWNIFLLPKFVTTETTLHNFLRRLIMTY